MTIIYAAATPVLYHFVDMGGYRIVPSVAISIDNYIDSFLLLLSPHSPSSSSQETATTYSVHGNGLNKSYGRSFFWKVYNWRVWQLPVTTSVPLLLLVSGRTACHFLVEHQTVVYG